VREELNYQAVSEPFARLAAILRTAAQHLLPAPAAAEVVRLTMSDLYRMAITAYATPAGPYATALDLVWSHLLANPFVAEGALLDSSVFSAYEPGPLFLKELCQAWACVWELAYLGGLSFSENELIAGALRYYDLVSASDQQIDAWLHSRDELAAAPRRAVKAMLGHDGGNELACALSSEIESREWDKSAAWHQRAINTEAIAP
jgi:hypothetical protein